MLHGGGADTQYPGHLVLREKPALTEAIIARRQAVVDSNPSHHHGIDGLSRARAQAVLGEGPSDLRVRVVGQQAIDFGNDFRAGLPRGPGGQRPREGQRLGGAAAEAHVHDELRAFEERDILDDQAEEALLLPHRRRRVVPQAGDILGELENACAVVLIERQPVHLALLPCGIMGVLQEAKLRIPLRFQRVGD